MGRMVPKKPKVGRPHKPVAQVHSRRYTIRFRKEFWRWLRGFAKQKQKTPGQVMTDFTVEGARKQGEEPPEP
jgi:predicted DNA-binding ribbon-helix-helix protein